MDDLLAKLETGGHLDGVEIARACELLFDAGCDDGEKACFLLALHEKGETADEIAHFARNGLSRSKLLPVDRGLSRPPLIDVCGTGGDRLGLFNVSTTVMFVVAACGARVVKHGNRSVTSKSGGADVLEALRVRADLQPEEACGALESAGCVFLLAPLYHPAFKAVAGARAILAQKHKTSIFNILGPLMNPALPEHQIAGVFERRLLGLYAGAFRALKRKRAWAVLGDAGDGRFMDEMSTLGATLIREYSCESEREWLLDFKSRHGQKHSLAELEGGDAFENAQILEGILRGSLKGARRDLVEWNAAGALVVCGLAKDVEEGIDAAAAAIDSGEALARLERLRGIR